MFAMMAAELAATGALVIRWFHGFSAGKSCCPSKVGTVRSSRSSIFNRMRFLVREVVGVREDIETASVGESSWRQMAQRSQGSRATGGSESRREACDQERVEGTIVYDSTR